MDNLFEYQFKYAILDAFSTRESVSDTQIAELIDANLEEWRQRKQEVGKVATARVSAMLMILENENAVKFLEEKDGNDVYTKDSKYYSTLYNTIRVLQRELELDSPWSGEINWNTFDETKEEKYSHVEVDQRILTIVQLNRIGDYLVEIGKMDEIEAEDIDFDDLENECQLKYVILDLLEANVSLTLAEIEKQIKQNLDYLHKILGKTVEVSTRRIIDVLAFLESRRAIKTSRDESGERLFSKDVNYPALLDNAINQIDVQLDFFEPEDNKKSDTPVDSTTDVYELRNKDVDRILTVSQANKVGNYLVAVHEEFNN